MNKNQPFRKYRPGCKGEVYHFAGKEVYHFAGKTPMFDPPGFITPMIIPIIRLSSATNQNQSLKKQK
jgi:hypothetical protein